MEEKGSKLCHAWMPINCQRLWTAMHRRVSTLPALIWKIRSSLWLPLQTGSTDHLCSRTWGQQKAPSQHCYEVPLGRSSPPHCFRYCYWWDWVEVSAIPCSRYLIKVCFFSIAFLPWFLLLSQSMCSSSYSVNPFPAEYRNKREGATILVSQNITASSSERAWEEGACIHLVVLFPFPFPSMLNHYFSSVSVNLPAYCTSMGHHPWLQ